MALGNNENNAIFIKKVSDKDGNPFWGKSEKVNGEYTTTETYSYVSGKLVGKIETTDYEYKKEKQYVLNFILQDGGERYKIQINYSYASRAMLNSLASVEDFTGKEVKLSLYNNKNGFATVWVEVDGERADWDLDPQGLPGNKDDKWLPSFEYFINKIEKATPAEQPKAAEGIQEEGPEEEGEAPQELAKDAEENDLPF